MPQKYVSLIDCYFQLVEPTSKERYGKYSNYKDFINISQKGIPSSALRCLE